ncbi:alkaline phosphatase PhoX [Marinicella rhabdoformis]|uniref:alkaline phosphatase PhoX n=1 Tax=Marinicella rhabdoformis TaxID=2580566 RepID=UPI0012AECB98|nr:alkaline phosphatase PhoX [Marinicella rhabdoformis]
MRRRQFIGQALTLSTLPAWSKLGAQSFKGTQQLQLKASDANGLMLLSGFTSRVVATEGLPVVDGGDYLWHKAPDGGAVFEDTDGSNPSGWIYVSNCESNSFGGVGAIKFNAQGAVIDGYRILNNTLRNCAGGKTPWGTWLSAEEVDQGLVWECDPQGVDSAVAYTSLGTFKHEAAAIDPVGEVVYLTEDKPDGCFYRTVLRDYPDLSQGTLQVAEMIQANGEMQLAWHDIPEPNPGSKDVQTRYQVVEATAFNGGEGIWYHDGDIYFSTKGDNKIWRLALGTQIIAVIYDYATSPNPFLKGVDNLTVHNNGQIYVCEDGGNLEIVMLGESGWVLPVMCIEGHGGSEVTGVAFTNDGTRMYFSSQRGPSANGNRGLTYEVTGPFADLDLIFKQGFES